VVLVPTQPQKPIRGRKSDYKDSPIVRASRKLVHEEHLITNYAALRLRFETLDLDLWRDVNHLDLKKSWGVPGVLLVPTTTKMSRYCSLCSRGEVRWKICLRSRLKMPAIAT